MVSSRESSFWKKNTAFSAECKEKGSVFLLLPLAGSPSQALTRQLSQRESLWQSTQTSSPCQGLSLWERWICEAKTERARMLSVVLFQKKEHRNARRCSGVPRFIRNDQIRLRASSSATRMKSGCICRMLAGTSGVTGPKKAFLTISALPAPLTTISTLRACMMVRMPMV